MAKKTYKTYHLKGLQVLLFDEDGRTMEVNFKGGVQIDSTAKFSTSDEKVQKALESCSGFNRDFYIESVREDNPVADTNAHAVIEEDVVEESAVEDVAKEEADDAANDGVVKVSDKSEAIEWLKEHYPEKNYTATKLRGKAFAEACNECGVTFEYF